MSSQNFFRARLNLILLFLGVYLSCIGVSAQAGQKRPSNTVSRNTVASSDLVRLQASYSLADILDYDDCEDDYSGQLMLGGRISAIGSAMAGSRATKLHLTENLSDVGQKNSYSSDVLVLASATKEGRVIAVGSVPQTETLAISAARPQTPPQTSPQATVTVDSNAMPQSSVWEIALTDKTLNAAIARWTTLAGWQLMWELPVDYAVEARTSVPGTFEEAVEVVAKSMETAEIPMKAIFYRGNKVLRIVQKGVK